MLQGAAVPGLLYLAQKLLQKKFGPKKVGLFHTTIYTKMCRRSETLPPYKNVHKTRQELVHFIQNPHRVYTKISGESEICCA